MSVLQMSVQRHKLLSTIKSFTFSTIAEYPCDSRSKRNIAQTERALAHEHEMIYIYSYQSLHAYIPVVHRANVTRPMFIK